MNEEARHAKADGAKASPRPLRELVEAGALFAALVVLSVIAGVLVKGQVDRRIDATVLANTIARAWSHLDKGATAAAEDVLITAATLRPALRGPLFWEFADYLPVMPRYRTLGLDKTDGPAGGSPSPEEEPALIPAELALRSGDSGEALSLLEDDSLLWRHRYLEKHLRAAAVWFDQVAALPDAKTTVVLPVEGGLPKNALLGSYLPSSESGGQRNRPSARGGRPRLGHLAAAALFCEGKVVNAQGALRRNWRGNNRASDVAYWLGVLAESRGDRPEALDWYGKAVMKGDGHLAGAQAYLRLAEAREAP